MKLKKENEKREPKDPDGRPSHLVSYDLYSSGATISQISKERNLSVITIQSHLLRSAEEGQFINWEKELPSDCRPLIEAAIAEAGTDKLKPIKELLPAEISYFMIQAFFFLRNSANN